MVLPWRSWWVGTCAQLWVALPAAARFADPAFAQYVPGVVRAEGFEARVFLGTLLGSTSPVGGHSPLAGAEMTIDPGRAARVRVDVAFEYGILVDSGVVTVDGTEVATGSLAYVTVGREMIELRAPGEERARVLIVGGTPLGERIVMWWNFVGRTVRPDRRTCGDDPNRISIRLSRLRGAG